MPLSIPRLIEYKKHLKKFFQYASYNSDMSQHVPRVAESAGSIFTKLEKSDDGPWSFSMSPPWEIPIADVDQFGEHQASLLVGGLVFVENNALTNHSFSVCISLYHPLSENSHEGREKDSVTPSGGDLNSCCAKTYPDSKRISRRFHFDIDCETKKDKPVFHFQFGGKVPKELFEMGFHYCLDAFIENPRIPYPPVDIVLLLDMLLREFTTPLGSKFVKEKEWKGFVRKSEQLLLKDYYDKRKSHFSKSGGPTLCESLYGENV